jgi:hypothetical protein
MRTRPIYVNAMSARRRAAPMAPPQDHGECHERDNEEAAQPGRGRPAQEQERITLVHQRYLR